MTKTQQRTPLVQWVLLVFLIAVVGFGMFLARNQQNMDWGPIILGGLGLVGFLIRSLFKTETTDEDGYP